MGGITDLLERRDVGLYWVTFIAAALLFAVAALLPAELSLASVGALRPEPWEDELWRFGVWAPSGWVSLAGLAWVFVSLWVVQGTRAEGEPPESAGTLLSFSVAALLAASACAGADLAGVALAQADAVGVGALALWLVLLAVFGPWRQLSAVTDDDPGRRLERIWRLHGAAGRALSLGALAPMLVVLSWQAQGAAYTHGDPSGVTATLAVLALVGVCLAAVSAHAQDAAVGLDDARLGIIDLPPQPARRRFPQALLAAGSLALVLSGLGVAPWPEAAAVQQQLVHAGLAAPADGRSRWMVVDEHAYRSLVGDGVVRVDVAPSGEHVTATVDGQNPGFWVLWEQLSWYPQQLRELWSISEMAFSADGQHMVVGRRRGLLSMRAFPSGREDSGWSDHHWSPVWSPAARIVFVRDVPHALAADGTLKAWSSAERIWQPVHTFDTPPQGMAASPDGTRLAVLTHSYDVTVYDVETFSVVHTAVVRGARQLLWDGAALLAVGQGAVRLGLEDGTRQILSTEPVRSAALDGQGRLALATHGVEVRDARSGTLLMAERRLARGGAASVSWSQDGSLLAVGSTAGNLELWWLTEHRWGE